MSDAALYHVIRWSVHFPVLGALYQMQGAHPAPRRTPTAKGSGSGRLDRPDPGRLLLGVDLWHPFPSP